MAKLLLQNLVMSPLIPNFASNVYICRQRMRFKISYTIINIILSIVALGLAAVCVASIMGIPSPIE